MANEYRSFFLAWKRAVEVICLVEAAARCVCIECLYAQLGGVGGIYFSPVLAHFPMPSENQTRKSNSCFYLPSLDRSSLVPVVIRAMLRRSTASGNGSDAADIPNGRAASASDVRRFTASRMETLRQRFRLRGFSPGVVELLLAGSRRNTRAAYESAWKNWVRWCLEGSKDPLSADLKYLRFLVESKRGGQSLQHDKSASFDAVPNSRVDRRSANRRAPASSKIAQGVL